MSCTCHYHKIKNKNPKYGPYYNRVFKVDCPMHGGFK